MLLSAGDDIGCGPQPEHRPNPVRQGVVDHLGTGDGLSSPRTRQGIALPAGDIWVATEKALDRLRDGRLVDSYDHSHPAPIPVGRINAMATDGTGATWIGTSNGLVRFEDGAFTESFAGLPDSRVLSLLATDDAMLVGTWRGLARIANGHSSASAFGDGLPDRPVTTMLAGDSLWVGFAGSGLWVGSLAGPFTPVVESWQHQALTVTSLTLDPTGDVWIGTSGAGLLRWRSSGTPVESILPSANILSATIDSTGGIWVGSNSGVYRWRGTSLLQWSTPQDSISVTAFAHLDNRMLAGTWGGGLLNCDDIGNCSAAGLDDAEVVDIAVIDGTVWVTMTGGLVVVDDRTETGPRNQVLKGVALGSIHLERGDVWITAESGGLYQLDRKGSVIRHYHSGNRLPRARILSLAYDENMHSEKLWLGTTLGLFHFDGVQFTPHELQIPIYCLHLGPNGDLWVGSDSGLFRRSGHHFEVVAIPETTGPPVVRALLDDGDALWVGTDEGLYVRDAGGRWQRIDRELPSQRIRGLAVDDDRQVWIATTGGMAMYSAGRVVTVGPPRLEDSPFTCVLVDSGGQIWMGSLADGAWRFDGLDYHHYSAGDGLNSNAVWDLFEDQQGAVWLATDRGLTRIARDEGDSP